MQPRQSSASAHRVAVAMCFSRNLRPTPPPRKPSSLSRRRMAIKPATGLIGPRGRDEETVCSRPDTLNEHLGRVVQILTVDLGGLARH